MDKNIPADEWVLLLMDAGGKTHGHHEVRETCAEHRILLWFGEPDTTSEWQPVDAGIAKELKELALGDRVGLDKWLESKANRKRWTRNQINAQARRLLSMKFLGAAWDSLHSADYSRLRMSAWRRTGCLITADGSDDHLIRPQGLKDYTPPPAGSVLE